MREVVRLVFPWSLCGASSAPGLPLPGVLLAADSSSVGAGVSWAQMGLLEGTLGELSYHLM